MVIARENRQACGSSLILQGSVTGCPSRYAVLSVGGVQRRDQCTALPSQIFCTRGRVDALPYWSSRPSAGGSIWSSASKSVTEKWGKYVSRIQLCSLPGMMARRCRNAMVRSPNPCLATYSRCRNFWHSFVGQKRHPSNACVGREYPASTRWRTVTGNGLIHMYLTQLPRNSGPKHMAQNPQTEILVLAPCAQFFDRFRGIQRAAF